MDRAGSRQLYVSLNAPASILSLYLTILKLLVRVQSEFFYEVKRKSVYKELMYMLN